MKDLQTIFEYIINLINTSAKLLIGIALVGFLWGILKYFRHASNPSKRDESKKYMVYGLFSMFVIVSFWGLILLVGNVFGVDLKNSKGNSFKPIEADDTTENNFDPTFDPNDPNENNFDPTFDSNDPNGNNFDPTFDPNDPNGNNFDPTFDSNDPNGNSFDDFESGYDDF